MSPTHSETNVVHWTDPTIGSNDVVSCTRPGRAPIAESPAGLTLTRFADPSEWREGDGMHVLVGAESRMWVVGQFDFEVA